ncbi:MAG: hypothetical protein V7785_06980 [Bermanella sp.]
MKINLLDISLVDLLNTGITGFAVVLLYLGYKLTSGVQAKILSENPSQFSDIEMFREWKGMIDAQLKNTRYFMLIALLFFAGGVGKMMYDAESKIIISVGPIEKGSEPVVRHQSKVIRLSPHGAVEVFVKDEHNIVIANDAIIRELNLLRLSNMQNQDIARSLVTKDVSSSNSAGFGL